MTQVTESTRQYSELRSLQLAPGATGAALSRHDDSSHLESIVAHDSAIDDAGLAGLSHCHNLKRLQLNGAPITDAGLVHLAGLIALEELNLTGTYVTDAGLSHLQTLKELQRFSFNGTSVSLSGVIQLFVRDQGRTLVDALAAMPTIRR